MIATRVEAAGSSSGQPDSPTGQTSDSETGELEREFSALAVQWQRESGMLSTVRRKITHPAYQRIIGLGQPVVPLLLRELRNRPGYWFAALQAITGENPAAGAETFDTAREAWLRWGRERQLV